MTSEQFTPTGSTEPQFRPVMSEDELREAMLSDEMIGFCTACGDFFGGYEPDARRLPCPSCRQPAVYGLEELVSSQALNIK